MACPEIVFLAQYGKENVGLGTLLSQLGAMDGTSYSTAVRLIKSLDLPRYYRFERLTPAERLRRKKHQADPEKRRARSRRFYKNNTAKMLAIVKNRRQLPAVRVLESLRERISKMVKSGRMIRKINPVDLIGCTRHEYVIHIESTWAPWMTWENYGTWEVDHIIPLKSFDLKDVEQVRACFHFRNCQALSRRENRAKANL